jgi:hypothetical protein
MRWLYLYIYNITSHTETVVAPCVNFAVKLTGQVHIWRDIHTLDSTIPMSGVTIGLFGIVGCYLPVRDIDLIDLEVYHGDLVASA